MSLSYFNTSSVSDGTSVISTVNLGPIVSAVQAAGTDTYFDSTAKIGEVDVFYVHQDGRQYKRLIHKLPNFTCSVSWAATYTRDGTWQKNRIKVYDNDGAETVIYRNNISSSEDLTHTSGIMTLNNS